jgi:hypothetical protein
MKKSMILIYAALVLSTLAPLALAQDDEEGTERDLRPARERHALTTELATGRWHLEFDYDTPDHVVVEYEDGSKEVVWFMTFTVRNPLDRRVPLRLSLQLSTDVEVGPKGERRIISYTDGAHPKAEKLIEAKFGELENSATEMRGKKREDGERVTVNLSFIEPGELRKGVAIFGAVTPHADSMTVEVQGLIDPIKHERKEVVTEVKVLRIVYSRPGDAYERHKDILEKESEEWIVRSRKKIRDREP